MFLIGNFGEFASRAGTLIEERTSDLRQAGVPLGRYSSLSADFWDDFPGPLAVPVGDQRGV